MSGKVWLVGAGPGTSKLLTLHGLKVLQQAQVVVYDQLVDKTILCMIPESAEVIDAGKYAGNHKMEQGRINELLCEKAEEGKRVVRLKGGDPFVFGRGAEEAEALVKRDIPFEVVPGLTSAITVLEAANIPVTSREHASSFYVVTAHGKRGSSYAIDYKVLAALKKVTLIFLMGVGALKEIVDGLLAAGKEADCPAAVIQNGARQDQRVLRAPLSNLYKRAVEEHISAPAVIVVGEVCAFYEMLTKESKKKRRVIVTRPKAKNSGVIKALKEHEIEVIEQPTIQITKVLQTEMIREMVRKKDRIVVAFTSETGVNYFFEQVQEESVDFRDLLHMDFAVIGKKTAIALHKKGIWETVLSKKPYGIELGKELEQFVLEKGIKELYIVTPENQDSECFEYLRKRDIKAVKVKKLCLYRTEYVKHRFFDYRPEDIVTFTSKSCVEGFVRNIGREQANGVQAVCIGETTKWAADQYNMTTVMAKEATMESVAESVIEWMEGELSSWN